MNIIDHFTTGTTTDAVQLSTGQVVAIIAKDAPTLSNVLIGTVTEVTETGLSIGTEITAAERKALDKKAQDLAGEGEPQKIATSEEFTLDALEGFNIFVLGARGTDPLAGAESRRAMLLNDGDVFAATINGATRLFKVIGVNFTGAVLEGQRTSTPFGKLGHVTIVEHRGESTLTRTVAVATGQLELVAA